MRLVSNKLLEEAREYGVRCPACKAGMVPANVSWWDCINPFCESGRQPGVEQ